MKNTIVRNKHYGYIGPTPNEIDAMREINTYRQIPLYGFMPVTPGKADVEKDKYLEMFAGAGDLAYLAVSREKLSNKDDIYVPILDARSRSSLLSFLAVKNDKDLATILEGPAEKQFAALSKLYNTDPGKYGPGGMLDLRRILMRTQFVRDWELYLKIMSGKDGALGKAERESMFSYMRKSAEEKFRSDPAKLKGLLELINKVEKDTEAFLQKEGGGLLVLMKQEWGQIVNGVMIKDTKLRKAFYDLAIEATQKANWTAGKRRESLLDKDGIRKFFNEINKNAPEEIRKNNQTAEKQLTDVMEKYKKEKDEDGGGFSQKTYAVLCSTVAIDKAANAFSLGVTISDGDRVIYMNSCVTPEHGADIKCAEMNMNGEFINYVENEADMDYEQDKDEYQEYTEQEQEELEEIQEEQNRTEPEEDEEDKNNIIYDLFGDR